MAKKTKMTKEEALSFVATRLAIHTLHVSSAFEDFTAMQLGKEAGRLNREAADALGCADLYDKILDELDGMVR